MKLSCCDPMKNAQQDGTDSEGWQSLIEMFDNGFEMGLGLPPILFCPWCGTKIEYQPSMEGGDRPAKS